MTQPSPSPDMPQDDRPLSEELLHFSAKPLRVVEDVEQERDADYKPKGLWLSVGPEWAEWCNAENFGLDRFSVATRVLLCDDANVLRLTDAADLDAFTAQYGCAPSYRPDAAERYWAIKWFHVAADFDGIIIAPYCYERRMSLMWYYGWDVASGCIWNARAVASTQGVELARPVARVSDDGSEEERA